jgi:hypothetical protein
MVLRAERLWLELSMLHDAALGTTTTQWHYPAPSSLWTYTHRRNQQLKDTRAWTVFFLFFLTFDLLGTHILAQSRLDRFRTSTYMMAFHSYIILAFGRVYAQVLCG